MAVGSIAQRSATGRFGLRSSAGLALALLAASLAMPADVGLAADASTEDQVARLDRLSTTIGDLKASLIVIRQDLEAMRTAPEAGALLAPDASCGALPAKPPGAGEVVAARVKRSPGSPIETAAAAELDAPPRPKPMLAVAAPAAAAKAAAPDSPTAADGGADLQLRADLALAQLKIVELTKELRSMRANRAALEAELGSLRSLTDAKIKSFMGWQ
jgi:hypothetical protein